MDSGRKVMNFNGIKKARKEILKNLQKKVWSLPNNDYICSPKVNETLVSHYADVVKW